MQTAITILFIIIAFLDVYASVVLFCSAMYDAQQKCLQLLLILILPIIGSVFVLSLAKDSKAKKVRTRLGNSNLNNYEYDSTNDGGNGSHHH
jgi:hypothetical protein